MPLFGMGFFYRFTVQNYAVFLRGALTVATLTGAPRFALGFTARGALRPGLGVADEVAGRNAASISAKASAVYTASFCMLGMDEWQPVKPKFMKPA